MFDKDSSHPCVIYSSMSLNIDGKRNVLYHYQLYTKSHGSVEIMLYVIRWPQPWYMHIRYSTVAAGPKRFWPTSIMCGHTLFYTHKTPTVSTNAKTAQFLYYIIVFRCRRKGATMPYRRGYIIFGHHFLTHCQYNLRWRFILTNSLRLCKSTAPRVEQLVVLKKKITTVVIHFSIRQYKLLF